MAEAKKQDKPSKKNKVAVKALEKKDGRKDATKKAAVAQPGAMERTKGYLRGVLTELKKVHWPTRKETMIYTAVVGVSVVFVATLIWIFDAILGVAMSALLK